MSFHNDPACIMLLVYIIVLAWCADVYITWMFHDIKPVKYFCLLLCVNVMILTISFKPVYILLHNL